MVLVTLGVVYGDIGTSPMYTLKAIMSGNGGLNTMQEDTVLGALSLLIWTITLITTVKYVLVAMKADNHNEGGIFALFSLVRRCARWLILPAMIGGAALLADGILTPAVTVTTAVEGLRTIDLGAQIIGENQTLVVLITIAIISALFFAQRAGTSSIGKAFGPIMTIWFLFLGGTGLINLFLHMGVLKAFNPVRGLLFLFDGNINHAGIMVLGNVFLCTTGAEALYSDMGHVGKANIYFSWPFVKACLILNYLGQGAWILANNSSAELLAIPDLNPFYQMLPEYARPFAVVLSALAAIIASQALITGSYSIVSEATRLDLLPHMKIDYPSETKGQIYIPLVNTIMWIGCIGVVLFFQTSSKMEAAYGLAITLTMLMTTILLTTYLADILGRRALAVPFALFFGAIELVFFFASLTKFTHGGYVTVLMALAIFYVMYVWRRGTAIESSQSVFLRISDYIDQIRRLRDDESLVPFATNTIFLTKDSSFGRVDRDILYSILDKKSKRAKAYWFVNVHVTNEPYTHTYTVNNFGTDFIFKVQMQLGFRVEQRVNTYLRQIASDLIESGELPEQPYRYSIYNDPGNVSDFRYVLLRKQLTPDTDLSDRDLRTMNMKYVIRQFAGSPMSWYGLENSNVEIEYVPLFSRPKPSHRLDRIPFDEFQARVFGRPKKERKSSDQDTDIFSEDMARSRQESTAEIGTSIIGGNTAVFDAVLSDSEDDDEE